MEPNTDRLALPLQELAVVLVKHFGLHKGIYDLAVELKLAVGQVGTPEDSMPGAIMGIARIGLQKTDKAGPHTVDAAAVNPTIKKPRRTKAAA